MTMGREGKAAAHFIEEKSWVKLWAPGMDGYVKLSIEDAVGLYEDLHGIMELKGKVKV